VAGFNSLSGGCNNESFRLGFFVILQEAVLIHPSGGGFSSSFRQRSSLIFQTAVFRHPSGGGI
jgi:hypothetical protein